MPIGVTGLDPRPGVNDPASQANQYYMQQLAAQMQNSKDLANIGANANLGVAKTNAGASNYGADASKAASNYQADKSLQSAMGVSGNNRAASNYAADQGLASTQYSSDASKAASEYGADASAKSSMYGADAAKSAALGSALYAADASKYGSDQNLAGNKYVADQNLAGSNYASDNNLKSTQYSSDAQKAAAMYGADQSLAGVNANVAGENQRQTQTLDWDKQRFGTLFDFLQGYLPAPGSTTGGAGYPAPPTGAPSIDTSPVLTPDQIQANVNNAVGRVDQRTSASNKQLAQDAAGRGIAQRKDSPLLAALTSQSNAIGAGQGADAELNFRTQAAQANSQQQLSAQQAAYNAWNGTQALGLQHEKNQNDLQSSIMQAIMGIGNI